MLEKFIVFIFGDIVLGTVLLIAIDMNTRINKKYPLKSGNQNLLEKGEQRFDLHNWRPSRRF